jgi:AcrR family transcriptional regulator
MAPRPSVPRKPRGRYHHGNLRRALIDQALATIDAEGVGRLTLREIGTRLGVSRTALYRHFSDKRELLSAVATEGFRLLRHELIAAWEARGRGPAGFQAMGMAYVQFATRHPSHYRVMFGGFLGPKGCDPELAVEAEAAFRALVDALVTLQQDGIVYNDDPVAMARFVWAVVHGLAMLTIDGQLREPLPEVMRYASQRLAEGIMAGGNRRGIGEGVS